MQHKLIIEAIKLSRMPGVGAARFRELIVRYGNPKSALYAWLKKIKNKEITLSVRSLHKSLTLDGIAAAKKWLANGGLAVWFNGPGYPSLLSDLSEPPPVLFIQGKIPNKPMVAVVGTRRASHEALEVTKSLCEGIVNAGKAIISGGALGIDAVAHWTAISAKGETVAVLGTGIDVVYPPSHFELFKAIADNGALISELLPGTPPCKGFFPTRNRIVAALAEETVVIQAPLHSGACITAKIATRLGRKLSVVVPPPDILKDQNKQETWAGNIVLLKEGAVPIKIF